MVITDEGQERDEITETNSVDDPRTLIAHAAKEQVENNFPNSKFDDSRPESLVPTLPRGNGFHAAPRRAQRLIGKLIPSRSQALIPAAAQTMPCFLILLKNVMRHAQHPRGYTRKPRSHAPAWERFSCRSAASSTIDRELDTVPFPSSLLRRQADASAGQLRRCRAS